MSPLATSAIVFACIFGVALFAMFFKLYLPENHLSADSKDVVKMGMGTMATLAAIVLGLLIATAKGTYDAQSGAIQEYAAKVMLLDRLLAKYGTETKEARELLRSAVEATVNRFWANEGAQPANLAPGEARAAGEAMYDKIRRPLAAERRSIRAGKELERQVRDRSAPNLASSPVLAAGRLASSAVSGGAGVMARHSVRRLRPGGRRRLPPSWRCCSSVRSQFPPRSFCSWNCLRRFRGCCGFPAARCGLAIACGK